MRSISAESSVSAGKGRSFSALATVSEPERMYLVGTKGLS